jgi:hypothetical protein
LRLWEGQGLTTEGAPWWWLPRGGGHQRGDTPWVVADGEVVGKELPVGLMLEGGLVGTGDSRKSPALEMGLVANGAALGFGSLHGRWCALLAEGGGARVDEDLTHMYDLDCGGTARS